MFFDWLHIWVCTRILLETSEDKIFAVCHNGLSLLFDAFNILHLMYHEATACHVTQVRSANRSSLTLCVFLFFISQYPPLERGTSQSWTILAKYIQERLQILKFLALQLPTVHSTTCKQELMWTVCVGRSVLVIFHSNWTVLRERLCKSLMIITCHY